MSLLNGLSQMGAAVSQFAGNAGLEAQKVEAEKQAQQLADQLMTQREHVGRVEAGQIQEAAEGRRQTFETSRDTARFAHEDTAEDKRIKAQKDITSMNLDAGRYVWQPGTQDGKEGMWKLPTRGDEAPTFVAGSTISSRGGNGGKSVYEVKQQAWLNVHPGDNAGALDYASGRRDMPYAERMKWARSQAAKENPGASNEELDALAPKLVSTLSPPKPAGAPVDASGSISAARAAIKSGKDRNAVIQRLREHGITPPADL